MGKDGEPGGETTEHPRPHDPRMQAAKVHMLDGTTKDFELHRGSDGEVLFTLVSSDLSIEEREYFSLCFYDSSSTRHWLYTDKKILRQLKGLPWEFSFEVKFYPTVPSTLNDDHARYNVFLQLRNDIYSGRLPATIPTQALLGSLVAQAEFGDATTSAEYEQYLHTAKIAPNVTEPLIEKIKEAHKDHKGLTASEAEMRYLEACKQLSMYGVFIFDAKDKTNQPISIGICSTGVNIYKETIRLHKFLWQNIIKISYRKSAFSVKLKAGEVDKKECTLVYKVADYVYAKRIWKCGVEHHTFFRLIQPEDKPKSSLFRWGSSRFRYNGRTQFQTKMASQMFDHPSSTLPKSASSRLTQSCDDVANKHPMSPETVTDLKYVEGEGIQEPVKSPGVSYDIASGKRPNSTLEKVREDSDDDELVYTPIESPTSAAYYFSERSSLRSPLSQGSVSPSPGHSRDHHLRPAARRNLFGRSSEERVRLVSFHEPADYSRPISRTDCSSDLPMIPISDAVQLYHQGYYSGRMPSVAQPPIHHVPRNGVHRVTELQPQDDLSSHPLRFFVSVKHSGQKKHHRIKRIVHEGEEDTADISPSYYCFPSYENVPLQRLERNSEMDTTNIRQYSSVYHIGPSSSSVNHDIDRTAPTSDARVVLKTRQPNIDPDINAPRLIVRVQPQLDEKENRHISKSSFWKSSGRKSKLTSDTTTYPVSEKYEGPLEDVQPQDDLENLPLENAPHIAYSPKKTIPAEDSAEPEQEERRFRLIARLRHDGDDEVVEKEHVKPESYGIASTSYDGPLEKTARESDLDTTPIADHAAVYHSGQSWQKTKPEKKAILHLKSSSHTTDKTDIETEEKPEVRLIARVVRDETDVTPEKDTTNKARDSSSSLFGFWKSSGRKSKLTSDTTTYPVSEKYEGPLEDVQPQDDLENLPLENAPHIAYSPKKTIPAEDSAEPEQEERRFRLIARLRHDGDDEVVEKEHVKPESYGIASTSYDGPLEKTARESDLDTTPIADHAAVYHSGQSWQKTKPEKKAILHLKSSSHTTDKTDIETEEKPEVRLIARVARDETDVTPEKDTTNKARDSSSSLFGFWKSSGRKSKLTSDTTTYPVSEKYEGPLEDVQPQDDLENLPLENAPHIAYSPKKTIPAEDSAEPEQEERRFRLIARLRHDGDDEVVEKEHVKPESYGIASTSYDGPLEETARESDLDTTPIADHAAVYHSGQSWQKTKPEKKAILHLKSSSHTTDKTDIETEEKPEVRLIARVARDETDVTPEKDTTNKARDSSSSLFGFWKSSGRKSKLTSDTTTYPVSEKYEGPLEDVQPQDDLENLPLENAPHIAYSPKKTIPAEDSAEPEQEERRFRLIARLRHDGDDEVVEKEHVKPESYGIASTSYDGPLEETARESDLDTTPIADHAAVYHSGQSWQKTKPEKKAILHLKSSSHTTDKTDIETEEKPEVRLIARVARDETDVTPEKDTTNKARDSSSSLFGFWKSSGRKSKLTSDTTTYPVSEKYEGPLEDVQPQDDLENLPLENAPHIAYSPKKTIPAEDSAEPEQEERRFRLIARLRHDGDDEVVEKEHVKPESYGIASTSYDGPLEETARESDLDTTPIADHAAVYHSGQSWQKTKPEKKAILHLKSSSHTTDKTNIETEEKPEVRLIARVARDETDVTPEKDTTNKARDSSSSLFGFWKSSGRKSKLTSDTTTYPVSEKYEGPLEDVQPQDDLENLPLENAPHIAYSPKKTIPAEDSAEPEQEERRFRLIARLRHDGDDEVVEKEHVKPESYGIASTSYDGPLEETARESDLDTTPIADHAAVYHSGQSWQKTKPEKKAILHLKSSSHTTDKTDIETEEKPEVRLIARVARDETDVTPEKDTTNKARDSSSSLFGFWKSSGRKSKLTSDTTTYPVSEKYEGPLEDVQPQDDLENLPLENAPHIAYSPKKTIPAEDSAEPEQEERRFRLIARLRHDGDDEVVEKEHVKPESYGIASTSYDGPLEETARESDLDTTPIADHAAVYHSGQSWQKTKPEKKAILHLKSSSHTTDKTDIETEEKPEVRLIARVARDETDVTPEKDTTNKARDSSSSLFGFWKSSGRKSKLTSDTTTYPVSEKYEGPLEDVQPQDDLENLPLENAPHIAYSPKKTIPAEDSAEPEQEERRFRLIARLRHDGDDEVVEKEHVKPESYGIASTSYDGPLEETARESDLDTTPIADHAAVYHSGQSWQKTKPEKKAILHLKSSSHTTDKTDIETEEKPEVRLIARVARDETDVTPEKDTTNKARDSSSSLFGFWKSSGRKSKLTSDTTTYPVSEKYEGPLEDVQPQDDLENLPLENAPHIAYSPKKTIPAEDSAEPEQEERRFRLIARLRHDGDDEVVEKEHVKPESYGIASTSYDGPLEETARESDLDTTPIADHAAVYHSGQSWQKTKPEKKAILHLKSSSHTTDKTDIETEEKPEVRLIARVARDETDVTPEKDTTNKARDSSSSLFGFWKSSGRKSKLTSDTTTYPVSEKYEGPLEDVQPQDDLENLPLENAPHIAYSPKKTIPAEDSAEPEQEERRFRLIARLRHDGDDEVVEKEHVKPESYGIASTSYDGPLEETARESDLDTTPIADHAAVYHSGQSWQKTKPEKKAILHLKSSSHTTDKTNIETEEKPEVRLIARVARDETDVTPEKDTTNKARDSSSSLFGFWKSSGRKSKLTSDTTTYPVSEKYEGPLEDVQPQDDLENLPLENAPHIAYSPKKTIPAEDSAEPEQEERRFRLIARLRHDGDDEVVEKEHVKPESYGIASTSYDGPLEETARESDLDTTPIADHAAVYHSGQSWQKTKPEKKAILHLKSSSHTTDKTDIETEEKPEVRLIARVARDETDVTPEKDTTNKARDSSSSLFGFWKSSGRKSKLTSDTTTYPVSEKYEGPLEDVQPQDDLENLPLENAPHIAYSPKKTIPAEDSAEPEQEERRFRLIARLRHDGDDEVVEKEHVKPESYGIASTSYDGPLEETARESDLDTTPIADHAAVYHSGQSWQKTKPEKKAILHLKSSSHTTDKTDIETEEKPEVRLIARVARDETDVTPEKDTTNKARDSSSSLFGFWKSSGRKSKLTSDTTTYPVSEKYEGPLEDVQPQDDLENLPLENAPHIAYSPKKTIPAEDSAEPEQEERRFRLIARLRHDGDDEVVEKEHVKPESYGIASTSYDGPLEETARESDLDTTPIADHAAVYHSGQSWQKTKPEKKAILHLKSSSHTTDKTDIETEEKPEVRLIARVARDETDVTPEKDTTNKARDSSSSLFGFWKSSGRKSKLTSDTTTYPVSEKYEGPLEDVQPQDDLENLPLENAPHIAYSPKKTIPAEDSAEPEQEERRFRLIARLRHDGDDEVVEKEHVKPESYGIASTSYDGPLEETARESDLDTTPIADHAAVYHSGQSWQKTKPEKKAILHLKSSSHTTDKTDIETEEKPEVRLIARVARDETDVTPEKDTTNKARDSSSSLFGFWKSSGRKSKLTSDTTTYPVSEKYEGPLEDVQPQDDLENLPLENAPHIAYSPKKTIPAEDSAEPEQEERRFRLIARLRHDGDDEVVEKEHVKPESYGIASTSYDGPLEETARESDLDTTPIADHAAVYHSGQSWQKTKPEKKAILHLKSSSHTTDKTDIETEEKPEVRLIARVARDETDVTPEKDTTNKARDSSSSLFGFWKSSGRKSKLTSDTTTYPVSEKYEGPLEDVQPQDDLENLPLENAPHIAYSPKKTIPAEDSAEPEQEERRFRLIARLRHDGDDEVVEKEHVKPESYGIASTSYDGPLEETARESDLDTTPIADHAAVYHSGQSWQKTKPEKKAILHLKSSSHTTDKTNIETEEKPEVRLIARVARDETDVTPEKDTTNKARDSSSSLFGFWKSSGRKSKLTSDTTTYPVSEKYEGPLEDVQPQDDLENLPLENAPHIAYSPKKTIPAEDSAEPEQEERRFRLIARLRHDGDDEVVEKEHVKPESYGIASTSYDGPLEETARESDLDTTPIADHAAVYHSGQSWQKTKPEKKAILHLKSSSHTTDKTDIETEEKPEVRLIARVARDETDVTPEKDTTNKARDSSSSLFGFWKSSGRKSKLTSDTTTYPVSEKYEGPLEDVQPQDDLENLPLENAPHIAYSPKKTIPAEDSAEPEQEERRFRLIARLRHDGDDEVVEKEHVKPESYGIASTSYDGPLEETARESDLDTTPIADHAAVYHSGQSWQKTKPEKKAILHLKSSSHTTDKTDIETEEKPEVQLIARVARDETDVTPEKDTTNKARDSSSSLFGFWKSSGRKSKLTSDTTTYPVSEKYEGPLEDVQPQDDLENLPLENAPHIAYSPKKTIPAEDSAEPEQEERRFRLIARLRHDGDDEVVEKEHVKPESYGIASTSYDGPLEETARESDLDTTPIADHAAVYHSGQSWQKIKPEKKAILHLKSSSHTTDKTDIETEEKPEVRLIARVARDETDVTPEKDTTNKARDSSSSLFGFWKSSGRKSKLTSDTTTYPVSEKYEGPLEDVQPQDDLENLPLENAPHIAYSPKKTIPAEDSAEPEQEERRFRLIARLRHDGDDEVVEKEHVKPESYGIASTSYDGPLEETARESDLDTTPIADHAAVYHSGQSWQKTKPEKKAILHLKSSSHTTDKTDIETEEKPEVRLIARVARDETDVTPEKDTTNKARDSSSSLFGFWKSSGRKSKLTSDTTTYPVSEKYEGPLEDVQPQDDLENLPLENAPHIAYSPKKTIPAEDSAEPEQEERRFRLIARLRHDGDDEVVEKEHVKPESYGIASTSYDGPLEETARESDLDTTPIADHAAVYHSGQSWQKTKPEKKAILHLKSSSHTTDKTDIETEEKPEVRLIARVARDETDVTPEKDTTNKARDSSSSLFGFWKSSGRKSKLTSDTTTYPVSEKYEGPLEDVQPQDDLENLPLENAPHIAYSPKKTIPAEDSAEPEQEERRFRLIARLRHDGDDEVVEKEHVKPESYGIASTSYDGPLEETARESDLDTTPIADHAAVYHSGQSWQKTKPEKKAILHLKSSSHTTDKTDIETEEKPEVRLIARVARDETDVTPEKDTTNKARDSSSSLFGFWKSSGRKSKLTSDTTTYPVSEKYEGPLEDVQPQDDLENLPLENAPHIAYSPKKTIPAEDSAEPEQEERRFRLIARLRHDGDDEVVEKEHVKPESYGIASTSYDGPLEETARESDLDTTPIADHAAVYHSGQSWQKTKPEKKAILHLKSSSHTTDKTDIETEEKPEVRLIARVARDETDVTPEKDTTNKARDSSSSLFGFWKSSGRKSKLTSDTTTYPVSEKYEGPLEDVQPQDDLENLPLENAPHIAYSPKKTIPAEDSAEPEQEERRFRLIARLRHDGDDEVVEKEHVKPESYGIASTSYDGPLEETARESDLDTTPIADHAAVYHSGQSWQKTKPEKKAILHLKSSSHTTDKTNIETEEKPEVRLIARVARDETDVTPEKDTTNKARDSSSSLFGFWKSSGRKSKLTSDTTTYPVSEKYEGPLEDVQPQDDLENLPLENAPHIAYSPKKTIPAEDSAEPEQEERRFRLIARLRHDGDDEVVEKEHVKPESYGIASTSYDGPLEETARESDLDTTPIADHAAVYHSGQSWQKTKPEKKAILHLKSSSHTTDKTDIETEEKPEVRLIARVARDETDVTPEKDTTNKARDSSSSLFGFWKSSGRKSKLTSDTTTYPVSEKYEGPLEDVQPQDDLENLPLENAPHIAYSPKKTIPAEDSAEPEQEERRFSLIARLRHDGDDEVVEKEHVKPESYGIASTSYDGPLEETARESDLDTTPIADHAAVYHSGQSWQKTKPEKKAILHLKSSSHTTDKTDIETEEKPEVRLIARVARDETDVTPEKDTTNKARDSSSSLFGFWKSSGRKSKLTSDTTTYPVSEKYEGPLEDVQPQDDLENLPLENAPHIAYSPKKTIPAEDSAEPEQEERRFRLIARLRHDGDDEVVEKEHVKPESYGIASTSYDGPLEETARESDLDTTPIADHAAVYHSGQSWQKTKPEKKAILHLKSSSHTTDKTDIETEEKPEVRLIARVARDETDVTPEKDTTNKARDSSSSLFGFWKSSGRKSKLTSDTTTYPVSEKYEGPLEDVQPQDDLENLPLENAPHIAYSPKKTIPAEDSAEPEQEERRFRLIARLRHDGDDEVVEKEHVKPESYGIASTSYDGPLEETARESDLDTTPIADHAAVYHSGQSWQKTKPEKKAILHLKSSSHTTDKTDIETEEKPEVRLIARVARDETDVTPEKDTTNKARDSSSSLFGFWKSSGRKSKHTSVVITPAEHEERCESQEKHIRCEGTTSDGQQWIEVRVERRVEIQLEPVLCLSGAGLGAVSEDDEGRLIFSSTPPPMAPPGRSLLSRLGFKSKKNKKAKGEKEADSSDSSSSDDEKNKFVTVYKEQEKKSGHDESHLSTPTHLADAKLVRCETNELKYHLKGEGAGSGFDPNNPSLISTIAEAQRLNYSSPRLELAERTISVRANAPLPVSFEESGQPHLTVASWQETNVLPDDVTVEYDEHGNKITKTIKTSQVKHTVQKQTFQNYVVPNENEGVACVERCREQSTPLGVQNEGPLVETHTRTVAYENGSNGYDKEEGLGEFVSSKTVTSGNRTVETITYKTEKDGIIETHVEHRVTIHSDAAIDYDAELSQAISDAAEMNPDMTVEKIEVRQETTN